jgi:flavodoxin I
MEKNVGIIYGTETGNTEHIAGLIKQEWGPEQVEVHNVAGMELAIFEKFDILILGVPSWYDGQVQDDWDEMLEDLSSVDLKDRAVALYGLGDQQDWGLYFIDAVGALADKVLEGGAKLIGEWPVEGYDFIESQAINKNGNFYGLAIDEDWQSELSEGRVKKWVMQLKKELQDLQILEVA